MFDMTARDSNLGSLSQESEAVAPAPLHRVRNLAKMKIWGSVTELI